MVRIDRDDEGAMQCLLCQQALPFLHCSANNRLRRTLPWERNPIQWNAFWDLRDRGFYHRVLPFAFWYWRVLNGFRTCWACVPAWWQIGIPSLSSILLAVSNTSQRNWVRLRMMALRWLDSLIRQSKQAAHAMPIDSQETHFLRTQFIRTCSSACLVLRMLARESRLSSRRQIDGASLCLVDRRWNAFWSHSFPNQHCQCSAFTHWETHA